MENEKKQEGAPKAANGERKPHHRRRRGYFIDPAQPKKESAAPAVAEQKPASPAPAQKNAQGQEQKQNTGDAPAKRKRHKKRHGNGQRPQNEATATNTEARNEVAPKASASPANDSKNQKQDKPSQRNGERPTRQNGGQKAPTQDRLIRQKDAKPSFDPSMYEEYEEVRFPAGEEDVAEAATTSEDAPVPMVEVVGIRFKSSGKVYYFAPNGKTVKRGDAAIVETASPPSHSARCHRGRPRASRGE